MATKALRGLTPVQKEVVEGIRSGASVNAVARSRGCQPSRVHTVATDVGGRWERVLFSEGERVMYVNGSFLDGEKDRNIWLWPGEIVVAADGSSRLKIKPPDWLRAMNEVEKMLRGMGGEATREAISGISKLSPQKTNAALQRLRTDGLAIRNDEANTWRLVSDS